MKNLIYASAIAFIGLTFSSCQKELTPTGYGQVVKKNGNLTIYSEASNKRNYLDEIFNDARYGSVIINSGSNSFQDYLDKKGSLSISGGGQYSLGNNQNGIVTKFKIGGQEIQGNDNPSQSISFGTHYEQADFNTYHNLFGQTNEFSIFGNNGTLIYGGALYCPKPFVVNTVPAIQDNTGRVEVDYNGSLKIYWNADLNNPDGMVYLELEDSEPYETSAPIHIFIVKDDGEFTINGDILSQYIGKVETDKIYMSVSLKRFNLSAETTENSTKPRVICTNNSHIAFFLK